MGGAGNCREGHGARLKAAVRVPWFFLWLCSWLASWAHEREFTQFLFIPVTWPEVDKARHASSHLILLVTLQVPFISFTYQIQGQRPRHRSHLLEGSRWTAASPEEGSGLCLSCPLACMVWVSGISVSPGWVSLGCRENPQHPQGPSSLFMMALTCHLPSHSWDGSPGCPHPFGHLSQDTIQVDQDVTQWTTRQVA